MALVPDLLVCRATPGPCRLAGSENRAKCIPGGAVARPGRAALAWRRNGRGSADEGLAQEHRGTKGHPTNFLGRAPAVGAKAELADEAEVA